ncbi:MAG TPA: ABC-2 transporter permease [Virgibacillus sp.]|nr:ABC-2 transporter permease [Virgibacillus sp.]HLR67791.1 ABC-2 transporter permease [Virgibacillus sp.]
MYNLMMKDFKIGIQPWVLFMPLLMGALMLLPGWIYFIVLLYFIWISIPNIFNQFKVQNDLLFTTMLSVTKKDMVKARIMVIVILEVLHIVVAMIFGLIALYLYPNLDYVFFAPHMGFWGLCFVMFGIFNILFFPMHYKTAYKYGKGYIIGLIAVMIYVGIAQWVGIQNSSVSNIFNGTGADNMVLQLSILIIGIAIFTVLTIIGCNISIKRFKKVDIS